MVPPAPGPAATEAAVSLSNCILRDVFSVESVSMQVCFSIRFSAKAWRRASRSGESAADDVCEGRRDRGSGRGGEGRGRGDGEGEREREIERGKKREEVSLDSKPRFF